MIREAVPPERGPSIAHARAAVGRAELCDRPKRGRLGCAISKCAGTCVRASPPTSKLKAETDRDTHTARQQRQSRRQHSRRGPKQQRKQPPVLVSAPEMKEARRAPPEPAPASGPAGQPINPTLGARLTVASRPSGQDQSVVSVLLAGRSDTIITKSTSTSGGQHSG